MTQVIDQPLQVGDVVADHAQSDVAFVAEQSTDAASGVAVVNVIPPFAHWRARADSADSTLCSEPGIELFGSNAVKALQVPSAMLGGTDWCSLVSVDEPDASKRVVDAALAATASSAGPVFANIEIRQGQYAAASAAELLGGWSVSRASSWHNSIMPLRELT